MYNQYPPWWNADVTLYNKYTDPTTKQITWYRKPLSGCFWKNSSDKVKIGNTVLETESTTCRIRIDPLFIPAGAWQTLPAEDRETYFTLGVGDILVLGEVDDEINEYETGKRSSDLLTKYHKLRECLQIDKAVINVGDRGIEHYRVKGV